MTTTAPTVLWAQRSNAEDAAKNVIYLTIQVVDPVNTKLDLTSSSLKLTADSSDKSKHYDLSIDFYEEIDEENSRKNTDSGSHIYLVLRKKTPKEEFWPRLTKEKLKYHYIKTDFDKWVDEDEQDEEPEKEDDMANMMNLGGGAGGPGGPGGPGGLDFASMMGGAGGAGGPGGIDFASMMGGAGGAGGPGGLDLASLMGGAGGAGDGNFDISQLASQLGQAGSGNVDDADEGEDGVEEVAK
ncbi:HSP20-like chaperone [Suhomyces tanzawaensis NRRL Y-17324]|uniref:HSP20-like chaperone n=1 Tax=Suhomyces tanzawaensis NRRL Y-17324 TaxID=984487 RepID=A0A1E4SFJ1_9ASCO|nr:HSP20-like chaperone [Suhomyces tanzawaensis NRRL Y-17324]ODV78235.1 HSP20-like chaperone [Suhomyces tanzawaensis NRRL Y-17324]